MDLAPSPLRGYAGRQLSVCRFVRRSALAAFVCVPSVQSVDHSLHLGRVQRCALRRLRRRFSSAPEVLLVPDCVEAEELLDVLLSVIEAVLDGLEHRFRAVGDPLELALPCLSI